MKRILWALATALWPAVVFSYASTDSIQDADPAQSGYLPNHNMDPNVVGGSSFGVLWQTTGAQNEVWYAKPLTYTLNGGSEMVITASNMNNVRVHDSKNGALIASRLLYPPFLQSDIGCGDIPNYIGVTGTPIIDPATDIIYMMAKGYKGGAASGGMPNGIYKLHALQLPSLTDAPGFPVLIDGHNADNDPTRYFVGGTVLQRPSLTSLNGAVIAAFGGHCDLFNYTGMLVSVSKTPGVGVVSLYAMEAAPGAPTPQPLDLTVQNGGKAGIWQSGMGLATDGSRIFAVTGNGKGHANGNVPASGRLPLSTLDEVVGNFAVSSAGKITLTDYFEPYDYVNLDAGDQDLGSSGLALLDASTFKTPSVARIAVTVGKNSKVYVLNAENLGGFKQGAGGTDNIIQTITASNSVFGGAGSYPLEGGYFYFTPVGDYTYAYKFGTDSTGRPLFSLAGKTPTTSAGRAGVGQPTVTTNGGRAGSGILWITDVNTGLRAFKAVPDSSSILQSIPLPATPGINKYQRPAFGDGRVFVTSSNKIVCLGAPVNLPISCNGPIDFGNVQTGGVSQQFVSCKANVLITKVNGCTTGDKLFQCDNSTLPQGQVTAGTTFTFPVTWNLTQKAINDAQGVSYGRVIPGVEGTVLSIFTTNGVAGYSTTIPVSISGTVVSSEPFLFMSPTEVDFGGLVLGSSEASHGLTGSAVIQNIGNSTLTITGVAWQDGNTPGAAYHNVTYSGQNATFDQGFSAPEFVVPGQRIAAGDSFGMPLLFNTQATGSFAVRVTAWSDGGVDTVIFAASAGNPPIASIAVSTSEGGWDNGVPTAMHFGNVLAGSTVTRQIRICNTGGSVLTVTKSKPPIGAQLTATNPYGELLEGQKIDVGACAYGSVAVYASPVQPNHPSQYVDLVWVLNTDGLDALNPSQDFGVHDVQTDATIVTRQIGPLLANGTAEYQWVGCFKDTSSVGRNLQNQVNNAAQQANNTNEQCQTLCLAAGYSLAGTQYQKECWCGNTIKHPTTYTSDSLNLCTFACPGDGTESCGGDNGYMSLYADVTKFDIQAFYASLSASTSTSTSATSTSTSTSGSSTATGSVPTTGTSTSISGTASGTSSSTSSGPTTSSSASPLNPNEPDIVSGQWKYIGCYQDNVNGVRSLKSTSTAADTMTLESCAAFCSKYNYFGTEYGRECYCGYIFGGSNTTSLRATESDCSTPCAANSAQLCGTGNRLSVYSNLVYQAPPPSPSHVAVSGIYGWIGCYTEATNGRALSAFSYADDSMTVDTCAAFCAGKDTTMMGVEYGRECYCGNSPAAGSVLAATSDCSTLCKNNTLQYCGAGGRLDMYSKLPPGSSTSTSSSSSSVSSSSSTSTSSSVASVVTTSSTSSGASSSTLSVSTTTSSSPSTSTASSTSSVISSTSSTVSSETSSDTSSNPTSSSSTVSSTSNSLFDPASTSSSSPSSTASSTSSSDPSTSSTDGSSASSTVSSDSPASSSTSSNVSTDVSTADARVSTSDVPSTSTDASSTSSDSLTSSGISTSSDIATSNTESLSSITDSSTSISDDPTLKSTLDSSASSESSTSTDSSSSTSTESSSTTSDASSPTSSSDSSTTSDASTSSDSSATSDSSSSTSNSSTSTLSTEDSTSTSSSSTVDDPATTSSSSSDSSTSTTWSDSSSSDSLTSATSSDSSSSDSSASTSSSDSSTSTSTSSSSLDSTSSSSFSETSTSASSTLGDPATTSSSSIVGDPTTTSSSSSDSSTSSSSSSSDSTSSTSTSSTSSSSTSSSSTSSSSTSSSSSSASSTSTSSSSSSSPSSSSTSTLGTPATVSATTTSSSSSSSSSTSTSTSSRPTATATGGYYHVGCYQDTNSGHALPQLAVNNSMTPELCIAAANSIAAKQPTPTKYPYVFVEFHNECYGGTSLNFKGSAVSSLYGSGACTDACSGSVSKYTTNGVVRTTTDLTNKCGGAKQFNLYVLSTPVAFPATALPVQTLSVK